ncbi:uncharacterized protein LOC144651163 [Oculina patagonica]
MEAKQGLILVLCSMILAGEVACFPTDVRAKSSFTQDDAAALEKYDDWRSMLKWLPKFVIRFLVKLFKGIARSDDPMDIVIAILEDLEGVFTKDKKNKKKKNKNRRKKKNKKENNENENNENKEEEPEPEGNAESEKPENESQDLN